MKIIWITTVLILFSASTFSQPKKQIRHHKHHKHIIKHTSKRKQAKAHRIKENQKD